MAANAYPMHVWRNFMEVFKSSVSENTMQDGTVKQNTINSTTLREASEKCIMNASTCSFGLLDRYLDAMQRCLVNPDQSAERYIELRRPSESTAPDVEEMILTLVDLVGMDADHNATMTRSEFCSIFSLLHTSVLPIVPQVTHQKDNNTMTIHMDEQEIKGNVQRCPYFRPQSEIIPNVEGFVENFNVRVEWENFLDSIDGKDKKEAAVAAAVAGGQVWLDHLVALAKANGNLPTTATLESTKLGPFSQKFLTLMRLEKTKTDADGKCADAAIAACYEWNTFMHALGDADAFDASEANVTENNWAEWKAKQWIDKWRQWLDPGWMDRAGDALNWKNPLLHLGVVTTGLHLGAYRLYKQKPSTPPSREAPTSTPPSTEAPTSTPQARTPKPQAPTPTHTNNTYTPRPTLNAGATVGLPDGTLARHIDGPTMGTLNVDDRDAKRRR